MCKESLTLSGFYLKEHTKSGKYLILQTTELFQNFSHTKLFLATPILCILQVQIQMLIGTHPLKLGKPQFLYPV